MNQKAVIFDIDGTLEDEGDRNELWYERFSHFKGLGYKILIFSYRDYSLYEVTETWLTENDFRYDEFRIKREDDMRSIVEFKSDCYEACKDRFNIVAAIDSDPQVINLWNDLELEIIQ